jgi:hypothetical protein
MIDEITARIMDLNAAVEAREVQKKHLQSTKHDTYAVDGALRRLYAERARAYEDRAYARERASLRT